MTAKNNPLYDKCNAWYDMINSTSYRTSMVKLLVDQILQHPCRELVKHSYIFTDLFQHYMAKDAKIASLPYNKAIIASREQAAKQVLVILNVLEITIGIAKS